jgi:hypothetical protein
MDKNENTLEQQDAPLKNTDNAFVRVKKDGSPELPEADQPVKDDKDKDRFTTIDHR